MNAILNREFKAYFCSPIGYVFLGLFLFVAGFFFYGINITSGSSNLSGVLDNMFFVFLFLIPIITMRLLSEERNQKTDQILLTSPVSVYAIVVGKFLAAALMLLLALLCTLPFLLVLAIHGGPPFAAIFASYVGYYLMGATYISIGLFVSALTENQAISAVTSFCVLLMVFLLDWVKSLVTQPVIVKIIEWLSLSNRFNDFRIGVLNIAPIIYYISFSAIFVFMTALVVERRRFK